MENYNRKPEIIQDLTVGNFTFNFRHKSARYFEENFNV